MRDIDPVRMAAWRRFLDAHAAVVRVLGDELRATVDLPLSWYDVLVTLEESPDGRLRMSDLAERVVLSQSGITRLVDRMSEMGLVRREVCGLDGRSRFAVLTPAGQQVLHDAAPTHVEGVWEHFASHLTDEEAATLATALERVARAAASQRAAKRA